MKWMDKKPISFITTFQGDVMVAVSKRGKDLNEARHIQEYRVFMEGIGIKDQSYEFERKRSTKCHTKLFKWLINILIHNALVLHTKTQNVRRLASRLK